MNDKPKVACRRRPRGCHADHADGNLLDRIAEAAIAKSETFGPVVHLNVGAITIGYHLAMTDGASTKYAFT